MNEKSKRGKLRNSRQMRALPFLLLWIAAFALTWLGVGAFSQAYFSIQPLSQMLFSLYLALAPGLPIALAQRLLVERGLKKSMSGWMKYSLVGLLLMALAHYITLTLPGGWNSLHYLMTLFLPVALVQTIWLHRRVKHAWLWTLAAVVNMVLFPAMMRMIPASYSGVLAGAIQGIVTGLVMRYLWTQPREKSKNEATAYYAATDEALARLAQSDDTPETQTGSADDDQQRRGQSSSIIDLLLKRWRTLMNTMRLTPGNEA